MEIIQLHDDYQSEQAICIGLGNFDGLHIAHQELIKEVVSNGKKFSMQSALLLFESHTKKVTEKDNSPPLLTSLSDKLEILEKMMLEKIYLIEFNTAFSKLSPIQFLKLLSERIKAKVIVVGEDYTFGHRAQGNLKTLIQHQTEFGYQLVWLKEIKLNHHPISSTKIRKYIHNGDMEKARMLLGRHYAIRGMVIPGDQRGRRLGFPTANLKTDFHYLLPKDGVYFTYISWKDMNYPALTMIGANLTFDGYTRKIENYLLDFDQHLYGERIQINFISYLRSNRRFDSERELICQIQQDKIQAKQQMNHLHDQTVVVK